MTAAAPAAPVATPRWLPYLAGLAGLVAAVTIPGQPPGLGTVLAIGAIALPLFLSLRSRFSRSDWLLGGLLAALLAMLVLRDAQWLVALDLLAVAALGTWVLFGARTWTGLVAAGVTIWLKVFPGLPFVVGNRVARPVVRGLVLAGALLLVFGGLFASADPAFASYLPSLDLLPVHVVVGLFATALVGAGMLTALRPLRVPALPVPAPRPRSEWLLPVVALDLLFAAFVLVQVRAMFGGDDYVIHTAGLSYAAYARQGFVQLVAVVVLTLGVVAAVVPFARDRLLARASLGVLCGLSFVLLASAWHRLALYEAAYGLTRLRIFVHAVIVGLALVLLLLVVAGALWRGAWLPRACIVAAATTLLGLNVVNPDALIVHRTGSTGIVDSAYVATLSADAAPALARLGICTHVPRPSVLAWNLARATASDLSC